MAAEDVDETGRPETPVTQALEKKKNKNLTYAAIAVGAIGVVLMIVLKGKSSSGSTGSTYGYPSLPGGAGGSGVDQSALQNLLAATQAGNTANQQANAGLLAAIAGLRDTGTGGSPSQTAFDPRSVGAFAGSGYAASDQAKAIHGAGGGIFQQLRPGAFESAVSSGVGTYWQPSPGVFLASSGPGVIDPATGKQAQLGSNPLGLIGGTPEFIKVQ